MNSRDVAIVPAIVPQSFAELRRKLDLIEGAVDWAQIDIADGLFTPDYTWDNGEELKDLDGKVKLEIHLMVEAPENYLADWLRVADRVIVHVEATEHLDRVFDAGRGVPGAPRRLGVALLLETPLEKVTPWVERAALIQLMSIAKIGHHGEPLDERVLERLRDLRAQFPDVTISVDGGVTLQNAKHLLAAGADHLVVGSAIWQAKDPLAALANFQKLIAKSYVID